MLEVPSLIQSFKVSQSRSTNASVLSSLALYCKPNRCKETVLFYVMRSRDQGGHSPVITQVSWDDQSKYHQEFESDFVLGRLSFLLPPPAFLKSTETRASHDSKGHTHTNRQTPIAFEECVLRFFTPWPRCQVVVAMWGA